MEKEMIDRFYQITGRLRILYIKFTVRKNVEGAKAEA